MSTLCLWISSLSFLMSLFLPLSVVLCLCLFCPLLTVSVLLSEEGFFLPWPTISDHQRFLPGLYPWHPHQLCLCVLRFQLETGMILVAYKPDRSPSSSALHRSQRAWSRAVAFKTVWGFSSFQDEGLWERKEWVCRGDFKSVHVLSMTEVSVSPSVRSNEGVGNDGESLTGCSYCC